MLDVIGDILYFKGEKIAQIIVPEGALREEFLSRIEWSNTTGEDDDE
jgi:hypothetical protein